MNRIDRLFRDKKGRILSVYFTAGYPHPEDTVPVIRGLEKNGADLVEIGMPFSDPVADGPIIQRSNQVALQNGMSVRKLFEQLRGIREQVNIPLILMGYLNPVLQFGMEPFCRACTETGIDGLILPDLPPDIYQKDYKKLLERYGIHLILLITPQTSEERLQEIDHMSAGFIYMVSVSSVTGIKDRVSAGQQAYFERIQKAGLKNPRLIGFGISSRETFENASHYARGAIVGSAFIKALDEEGSTEEKIARFMKTMREDGI